MSCRIYDWNLNTKFLELHCEIWLQSWNLLKIGRVKIDFIEYLWSFKLFVGTYITFLKGYDAGFPKNSKFWINFWFEKNFNGGSLYTGGVAGIRAVVHFSTTYFGEISIFELSKDQTFRNWSTLMNPEQFLILVTYLIIATKRSENSFNLHELVIYKKA
jgi:hypothetical protein